MDDVELLQAYANEGNDEAFSLILRRHVNLVYSAALRQARDPHAAEEIAQTVFLRLAKKAGSIGRDTVLGGWLYTATRHVASEYMRGEVRRRRREQLAMETMAESETPVDRERLVALLDQAMASLGHGDRDALILRFFEGRSLKEMGAALGISDDTAQKRVSRALEKLRLAFAREGLQLTPSALLAAIPAVAVQAAPAGLAPAVCAAAVAGTATATGISVFGGIKLMAATQLKTIVTGGAALAAATMLVIEHKNASAHRAEAESLRAAYEDARKRSAEAMSRNGGLERELQTARAQAKEVHSLRNQVSQLLQEQEKNKALLARNEELRQKLGQQAQQEAERTNAEAMKEQETAAAIAKLGYLKNWGLALHMFAADHKKLPGKLEDAAGFLTEESAAGFDSKQFEIVYHGPLDALERPGEIILVREKQPVTQSDGRRVKSYTFADGHSVLIPEPPEGFEAWERRRIVIWRP